MHGGDRTEDGADVSTARGRWRPQPGRVDPRHTTAGKALIDAIRDRVRRTGEPCWFHGKPGYEWHYNPKTRRYEGCPGRIDLDLPSQHRYAFTTHHTMRIMDGGPALPDPRTVPAAHRSCNSRDGLIAQNARRRASRRATATQRHGRTERTSESW